MKFTITFKNNSKIPVLFIHGFLKSSSDWNLSIKNNFNLEKNISKLRTTINIDFEVIDYLIPYDKVCNKIIKILNENKFNNIIIVAHSIGGLYAKMLTNYDIKIQNMILIETSEINLNFKKELKNDIFNEKNIIKKNMFLNFEKYFFQLPKPFELKNKNLNIIFLLNIYTKKYFFNNTNEIIYNTKIKDTLEYYQNINYQNTKANILLFYNVGHMIHYKKFNDIFKIIKNFD